jgi:regulator of protease activity HflC (stomatin/prohibitin superfamily)
MKEEKSYQPISGYIGVLILIVLLPAGISGIAMQENTSWTLIPGIICLITSFLTIPGFMVVNPNESGVLILFGSYKGTVKENGFYWVNPFFVKKKVSLRARNLDNEPIKVNDKLGNPIMIGIVLVWKVADTFKASFEVDDYVHFVVLQSESAMRRLAGHYAYDNFDDEESDITLRGGGDEVNHKLERELSERLDMAGIQVIEARIRYLAYSNEIAQAMLKRQQATAVVAARFKIVEGAVSMVEMALDKLSERNIVELDEDKKAAMVSNLMVVLCSDKDANPVINTGTLHQ